MADTINAELYALLKESMELNREMVNEYNDFLSGHYKRIIEGYENDLELKMKAISGWEEIEPPKLLNEVHSEWQEKMDKLISEHSDLSKKLANAHIENINFQNSKA